MSDSTSIDRAPVAAEQAAEAIRRLNHLTRGHAGYEEPADVYSTLVELHAMAHRVPQALRQAQEWLYREVEAGRVYDDRNCSRAANGIDPMSTVEHAAAEMTAAAVHLTRWAEATRLAVEHLSHLGGL